MRRLISLICFACFASTAFAQTSSGPGGHYLATAYCQRGETKSGIPAQRHIVAADPSYLPLGSKIKIRGAGRYSGEYVVADTGEKVVGRHLDIFIPDERAAAKFGRRVVRVRVISIGDDTKVDVKQAVQQVQQDVKAEVQKGAVGNAATEADWVAHHPAEKAVSSSDSGVAPK